MTLELSITEAVKRIIKSQDSNKHNVAKGYFQGYSTVEADESGVRFCDLKLHYKTGNSDDINLLEVPMSYPGSKNSVDDCPLEQGDELDVFFSDRSLEQWITSEPQKLANPIKDSVNHAFCYPINTHHNNFTDTPGSSIGKRITVKSGKKIQIGNGTDELLSLLNDNLTEVIAGLKYVRDSSTYSNGGGPTGPPSNGSLLSPIITNLEKTKTALGNIKD